MRGKELILAEVSNVPIVDRREAIELAQLEALLDIRFNLDRINQTLKDICENHQAVAERVLHTWV
jgi:hypothetical protein